jgi:hypothetical protein
MTTRLKWPIQGLPANIPGRTQLATTEPGDIERIASMLKIWLLTEPGERQLSWNEAQNATDFGVPLRREIAGTFEPLAVEAITKHLNKIVRSRPFSEMIARQIQVTSVKPNGLIVDPNAAESKKVQLTIQLNITNPVNINLELPLRRLPIYLESEVSPDTQ